MKDFKVYTDEEVLKAAEDVVAENGAAYVYDMPPQGCVYALNNDQGEPVPSCLVGHIVHRLNPEDFKRVAEWEEKIDSDTDALTMITKMNLGFTEKQAEALFNAQIQQDLGNVWAVALYYLERTLTGPDLDV